jgi:hypothetical protein
MRLNPIRVLSILGLLGVGVYYLVLAFSPNDYTLPSAEYYVSDYANVLSSASTDFFLNKSTEVYDRTKGTDNGGLQIVVATFPITSESQIDNEYNKTTLFRKWQIGENDMGLLIAYFYQNDSSGVPSLVNTSVEIGYRLNSYLTAGAMGEILDRDFAEGPDEETAQAHVYSDVLAHVIPDAYNIDVTPFDKEAYLDYQINYDGPAYGVSKPLSKLEYAFSFGGFWDRYGIPAIILGFVFFGDAFAFSKGAGGSSGGGGVIRWRH